MKMNDIQIGVILTVAISLTVYGAAEPTTQPRSEADEVREMRARKSFGRWAETFMKENVRPPKDTELQVVRRGEGGSPVDLIRAKYKVDDDVVTLSQIASALCVKIEKVDFDRKEVDRLQIVTQAAKRFFSDSDDLIFVWDEKVPGQRVGHAKADLKGVRPFVKYLEFEIRDNSLLLFGMKHRDGVSAAVLGWGPDFNNWFTLPPDNDRHGEAKGLLIKAALLE